MSGPSNNQLGREEELRTLLEEGLSTGTVDLPDRQEALEDPGVDRRDVGRIIKLRHEPLEPCFSTRQEAVPRPGCQAPPEGVPFLQPALESYPIRALTFFPAPEVFVRTKFPTNPPSCSRAFSGASL